MRISEQPTKSHTLCCQDDESIMRLTKLAWYSPAPCWSIHITDYCLKPLFPINSPQDDKPNSVLPWVKYSPLVFHFLLTCSNRSRTVRKHALSAEFQSAPTIRVTSECHWIRLMLRIVSNTWAFPSVMRPELEVLRDRVMFIWRGSTSSRGRLIPIIARVWG